MTTTEKAAIAAAILGISLAVGTVVYSSRDDGLPSCMAGENEICPSPKWAATYKRANELGAALRAGIPGGYKYDEPSGKFVKVPPASTQPSAPATPAKK